MGDSRSGNDGVTILSQPMVGETVRVQQQRSSLATLTLVQVCSVRFYVVHVSEFLRNSKSLINGTHTFSLASVRFRGSLSKRGPLDFATKVIVLYFLSVGRLS